MVFNALSANMVLTSHPKEDENDGVLQSEDDPWIRHLNTLWDIHFEQLKPPSEDKFIQINLESESNPKPIFISEILSPSKRDGMIQLIRKYLDVFT